MHGGDLIAEVLQKQGVRFLYTLCGGHISPILVGCKSRGIRVVDVRDEANAVFAADATARLTGVPGVAAVTAGPGVTNTLTAMQNAKLAQSPVVLLGGAAATMLRGRGALQDIDQMAAIKAHVKWQASAKTVAELVPLVEEAFRRAQSGVPGPVFVECPIDLLYDESLARGWYLGEAKKGGGGLAKKALELYLKRHLKKLFRGADKVQVGGRIDVPARRAPGVLLKAAGALLSRAERPVLLVGSQALGRAGDATEIARAVCSLGLPVWLAGMARGLLGRDSDLHMRHKRRDALKEADLVILAGVPCDFRLGYGRSIGRKAKVIAVNLSPRELVRNRLPTLPIPAHPGSFLRALASRSSHDPSRWKGWRRKLRERDAARDEEIARLADDPAPPVNPVSVVREIEAQMDADSVVVADGGDFVGTAAYVVRPRGPLRWLDPGVFGTLGVGAGFALAASLCRPTAEVWLIYGDGACGFSLIELDTFCRHKLPVIAVVGNDASWAQIARDQVVFLKDDVGTVLDRTAYHTAAEGLGAVGIEVTAPEQLPAALQAAKRHAAEGRAVLVNVHLGKSDFRKGSVSM